MSDLKQTVTQKDAQGLDDDGYAVQQRTKQIHTESSATNRVVATNLVWFVFGIIAILLALRFVLKLAAANPNNGFVSFIYSVSRVFSAPFDSIFGTASVTTGQVKAVFEPSLLVALAIYALIAWGIVRLLNITSRRQ